MIHPFHAAPLPQERKKAKKAKKEAKKAKAGETSGGYGESGISLAAAFFASDSD